MQRDSKDVEREPVAAVPCTWLQEVTLVKLQEITLDRI